ncbi:MAG: HD domain-containing protein [Lachnospiraceae bacterium]|nr:HD domain-containing protein [Lachnospiraceae bacterium]
MRYLAEIREGEAVSGIYLCKTKVNAKTKTGKSYYSLTLQDKTAVVDAKIWDLSSGIDYFEAMDYIRVVGEATSFQGAIQLNIRRVNRARQGEYDPKDYLPSSPYSMDAMKKVLYALIETIKNEKLRALVDSFFDDEEFIGQFFDKSAAKSIHHSFLGGLLQHTLRVTQLCDFYCQRYPLLQRDLLITGALLHDVGKVRELSDFPENDYTDDGQLLGHIVMGYQMVAEKMAAIPDFPKKTGSELLHLILSHHGEMEFGSPKKPALLEAVALHYADNTDAKLEAMSELLDGALPGETWLGYQKLWESNVRRTTPVKP